MDETIYSLLAKYFAGETTESEAQQITIWRNTSQENEILFLQLQKEWNYPISQSPITDNISKEKIWRNITLALPSKKKQTTYSRMFMMRVASVAAAVALMGGFSLSFLIMQNEKSLPLVQDMVVVAPSSQKSQLTLPDSSLVWLNSESKLTIPSDFNTNNRHLKLEGEAYFIVSSTANKQPFTVETENVTIFVTGTTFNVQAHTNENFVKVALIEGGVDLLSTDNQQLIGKLMPNQLAFFNKKSNHLAISSCDAQSESIWHQNKLSFDNCLVNEVWNKLERWYGVTIHTSNQNPNLMYRFTVKTESLTELLELINKITPIDYKLNGEEVQVRYK